MINAADIIGRGFESRDLDYKGPCAWDEGDKKACCEIVKDVLALANAGGGHLVFGVAETHHGFTPEGLAADQLKTFESSRLNRWIQNYADPPINCTLSKVEIGGKVYVIIEIPGFTETPHICQRDFPGVLQAGAIYVRTDNNESAAVRSSSDMRRLVERAVRNTQDKLIESVRAILTGTNVSAPNQEAVTLFQAQREDATATGEVATQYVDEKGQSLYVGYLELWSHPASYRPDFLSLGEIREAAKNADEEFTGWPFLFFGQGEDAPYAIRDGIEAAVKFTDFAEQHRADFWQIRQSGFFYQRTLMWEEAYARKQGVEPVMDFRSFATYVGLGIRCVTKLYERLFEDSELVTIGVRVIGVQGRTLASIKRGRPLSVRYVAKVPEIQHAERLALADWRAGLIDHALIFCDHTFQRFNWSTPNLNACRDTIERTLARRR